MASRPRAYWKGFLRLSLVSIAVEVFNAEETRGEVSFHQIHKPTGKRVNYSKTVAKVKGFTSLFDEDVILSAELEGGLLASTSGSTRITACGGTSCARKRRNIRPSMAAGATSASPAPSTIARGSSSSTSSTDTGRPTGIRRGNAFAGSRYVNAI